MKKFFVTVSQRKHPIVVEAFYCSARSDIRVLDFYDDQQQPVAMFNLDKVICVLHEKEESK